MNQAISVVILTLDEAVWVERALAPLQPARAAGHELILADGGSRDRTLEIAAPLVDRVVRAPRGRALQMNAGARVARGDLLVFLHADTVLSWELLGALPAELDGSGRCWGRFDLRLGGERIVYRLIERLINLRTRWSGIATGDQAIFVRRRRFEKVGGFPEIPLMEDVALSRALQAAAARRSACAGGAHLEPALGGRAASMRTTLLMWRLRGRPSPWAPTPAAGPPLRRRGKKRPAGTGGPSLRRRAVCRRSELEDVVELAAIHRAVVADRPVGRYQVTLM